MDIRFGEGGQFIGSGDEALYRHIVDKRRNDDQEWFQAARRLKNGLPFAQSIDDFLDQHRNDQHINLYGKAAIAKAIAGAERKSELFFDAPAGKSFDDDRIADTWLVKFMSMLSRGTPRENVFHIFDKVDFVIFNYDRCVEHFLINALARSYSIANADAASIVDALKILHPYGSIGDLKSVPFGTDRLDWVLVEQGIKTYTEQVAVSRVLNEIRRKLKSAECVVFLGFAYRSQRRPSCCLAPGNRGQHRPGILGFQQLLGRARVLAGLLPMASGTAKEAALAKFKGRAGFGMPGLSEFSCFDFTVVLLHQAPLNTPGSMPSSAA